jgi:hypothetical protein
MVKDLQFVALPACATALPAEQLSGVNDILALPGVGSAYNQGEEKDPG